MDLHPISSLLVLYPIILAPIRPPGPVPVPLRRRISNHFLGSAGGRRPSLCMLALVDMDGRFYRKEELAERRAYVEVVYTMEEV